MQKIVTYQFSLTDTSIALPRGAKVLKVGVQDNKPTLWVLVEPPAGLEVRAILSVATAESFDSDGLTYKGTLCLDTFYFHIFVEAEV